MNSYIARQPIFDQKVRIYAYELLYRSNAQQNEFGGVDANQASSRIIMESFHSMGVDTITGGKPAFINFTPTLLLENVATLFPKELLVIEITEDIVPTPEIVEVCADLRRKGYTLALDDFVYRPEYVPLIEISSIIKIDFLANTPDEIKKMLGKMDLRGKQLLAEKIETVDMFNIAASMGFTQFQGYFFSKPVTLASRSLEPLQANYISLLREVNSGADMSFAKLSDVIRNDVALTYKLLRLVNSAYYSLRSEVTDIKHALAVLGTKEIRKWISLMAMMGINTNTPDEIVRMSLVRGRFIENIGPLCRIRCTRENMFITGLFSMIDVLTNQTMSNALSDMVIATEVRQALVNGSGPLFDALSLVISMEKGIWEDTDRLASLLGVDRQQVSDTYLSAVKWCNEMPF